MQATAQTKAKVAAATISKAVLEHNVACAREGVKMATRATDAKSAIAAAACVVDAVSRIMGVPASAGTNRVGIETLQRAAAAPTTAEELAEIIYTAKLITVVTYAAASEALEAAAAAEEAKAAAKAAHPLLRRRNGYTRFDCRVASKH